MPYRTFVTYTYDKAGRVVAAHATAPMSVRTERVRKVRAQNQTALQRLQSLFN